MKKKLVLMAVLLFAICFAGFAQEAFSAEPSQYVAKAEEEQEYTFILSAEFRETGSPTWFFRQDKLVVIATSLEKARNMATDRFVKRHIDMNYSNAINLTQIRKFSIVCESPNNACDYRFSF